jgi:hypothetical protein
MVVFKWINDWLRARKQRRADQRYQEWRLRRINFRAWTLEQRYASFQYVVQLDWGKVANHSMHKSGPWYVDDIAIYLWPARNLDTCCILDCVRVYSAAWGDLVAGRVSDLGDRDILVFCTDSEEDAVMVTMRFS